MLFITYELHLSCSSFVYGCYSNRCQARCQHKTQEKTRLSESAQNVFSVSHLITLISISKVSPVGSFLFSLPSYLARIESYKVSCLGPYRKVNLALSTFWHLNPLSRWNKKCPAAEAKNQPLPGEAAAPMTIYLLGSWCNLQNIHKCETEKTRIHAKKYEPCWCTAIHIDKN